MTSRKSTSTLLSASALVLSLAAFPSIASAQSSGGSLNDVFDEIVVTATKKTDAENVQDVPVSMAAFNNDTLEALKVRDLQGLSFSSPNVSLDDIGTSRGTANFSIRGLGVNSSIPSIDPTVGVFVDGVYLGLNAGVVFDLFDLESIEVARGPQGILFGRNTTGGAVLINTGNPTDELEYSARVAYEVPGADDRGGANKYVMGTVSGPLTDTLSGKIGAYFNEDEGYFRNLANGNDHGAAETTILRAALEWAPTDRFTLLGKVEKFDSEGDGPSAQNRGLFDRESFDFSIDNEGFYTQDVTFATLRADYDVDFGNGTITNIFGYREADGETDSDIDSTPLFLFHSDTELTQEQISNELRYNGRFGNADVTTGVFFFNQDVAYTERRDLPPLSAATFYGGGTVDHTVLGLFGQVDYDVRDDFTVTVGGRLSNEEKEGTITYVRPRPECSVVQGTCPTTGTNPFIPGEDNGFAEGTDWSNFAPKLGFQYRPSDSAQIFGNYTKGFRSGGYNFRITNAALFLQQVDQTGTRFFDEEEVDSFELGVKYQTEDRRLTLNGAVFNTQIADMQREVNISSPTSGVSQFILNTADASITGAEIDGRWAVTPDHLLTFNAGLINAEYDDVRFDISGDNAVTQADAALDLPRVPESTFGVGYIGQIDLGVHGSLSPRVNYQYRDRFAYTDSNFGWVQEADMLDANLTYNVRDTGVSLSLYGKNLFDEVQVGGDTQLPFGGPQSPVIPGSSNLSNGVNAPFDRSPAVGTFSPLKKGRVFGVELTIRG